MSANEIPWAAEPPVEVPLENAPLVRVITQVRFPVIASVGKQDFIAPFQEMIRREYPVLRPEQSRGVVIGPQGVVDTRTSSVWRFQSSTGGWRVSLAPDFLALETTKYTRRDDFLGRFERVLVALRECIDPQVIDRLGVRYIDRVSGEENMRDLPALIRPEVAGVMATPLAPHTLQALSENIFSLPRGGGQLIARWGLVPAHGTVDPAAIDPIEEPSWLLDVDAFLNDTHPLDIDDVIAQARNLAANVYGFFRWVVTDEFLTRYGGAR
jgi:uncharacterized protein (TIGR04255 family)